MSAFQSFSAYRRSQPVRVTPTLHRKIFENHLILGARQFIASRFVSDRGKTAVNTVVFTRILTMSRHKYTDRNRLGFDSLHPNISQQKRQAKTLSLKRCSDLFQKPFRNRGEGLVLVPDQEELCFEPWGERSEGESAFFGGVDQLIEGQQIA